MDSESERFTSRARARLSAVLQTAKDLVTIDIVHQALGVDRQAAVKLLSRWQKQGWLKRVGRGIYAPIPLDASTTEQVLKDPWILIPALYSPGYLGGWSAAEHWDLTEQLFRSVFVFTARPFRKKEQIVQGVSFRLKRIPQKALFGIKNVWRGQARIPIADKHRTIVDLLDDPSTGGGIRHVTQCLHAYLRGSDADEDTVIRYAERLGNGAVFKRLGFLASQLQAQETLIAKCRERLSAGNAKLDPALPSRRLVKAWRLWIPRHWEAESVRD
jgi:predicted transcriptional regulator of viral defense system